MDFHLAGNLNLNSAKTLRKQLEAQVKGQQSLLEMAAGLIAPAIAERVGRQRKTEQPSFTVTGEVCPPEKREEPSSQAFGVDWQGEASILNSRMDRIVARQSMDDEGSGRWVGGLFKLK